MKEIHNCLVIGGDMRQIYMAEALGQAGFTVSLFGFEHLEETNHVGSGSCRDYYEALKGKDAVIFPLPLSRDNVSLNAPFAGEEILLADILHAVESGQIVFGGMLGEREKQYLKHRGIEAFDYFAREELTVRNAVATAEGVLQIVIEELPITVHGSHALVTGFGRTSKTICALLRSLGAPSYPLRRASRRISPGRQVEGMHGVFYEELPAYAGGFDYVVNTVPALVLGGQVLEKLQADCLLVEIASAPGGIDLEAAQARGLKVIKASSLPGKVAPKTAGRIISDTIRNVIREGNG